MTQSWHAWLQALIAQFETARACATFLGIDESKLSRWGRAYFQEPTATDLERLADRTRTPLPELLLMVHAALKAREALTVHPPVGERRRANLSLPQSVRTRARRRKLAAWAFAVGLSGSALGQPLGASAPRPNNESSRDSAAMAPIRGILSRSRRPALAEAA